MSTLGGAQQVSIFFGPPLRCFFWGCHRQLLRQLRLYLPHPNPGQDTRKRSGIGRNNKGYRAENQESVLLRNLSSSQWAAVAVEAEEILAAIKARVEEERRKKQIANAANQYTEPCDNKLSQPRNEHANAAVTKAAELFNTNRSYINDAATHESGNFGVSVNKLTETNQDERKAAHKTCETPQLVIKPVGSDCG